MSIYVEILVRAPMDALWAHTQTPALHERWDLRFSRIEYLPKSPESDLQRFRYATRIGFGFEVCGEGETVGQRRVPDGSATSALRFASAEAVSIIREGSGYWKYIPTADGIRFLTWYDYRTRFGPVGALVDRMISALSSAGRPPGASIGFVCGSSRVWTPHTRCDRCWSTSSRASRSRPSSRIKV